MRTRQEIKEIFEGRGCTVIVASCERCWPQLPASDGSGEIWILAPGLPTKGPFEITKAPFGASDAANTNHPDTQETYDIWVFSKPDETGDGYVPCSEQEFNEAAADKKMLFKYNFLPTSRGVGWFCRASEKKRLQADLTSTFKVLGV